MPVSNPVFKFSKCINNTFINCTFSEIVYYLISPYIWYKKRLKTQKLEEKSLKILTKFFYTIHKTQVFKIWGTFEPTFASSTLNVEEQSFTLSFVNPWTRATERFSAVDLFSIIFNSICFSNTTHKPFEPNHHHCSMSEYYSVNNFFSFMLKLREGKFLLLHYFQSQRWYNIILESVNVLISVTISF